MHSANQRALRVATSLCLGVLGLQALGLGLNLVLTGGSSASWYFQWSLGDEQTALWITYFNIAVCVLTLLCALWHGLVGSVVQTSHSKVLLLISLLFALVNLSETIGLLQTGGPLAQWVLASQSLRYLTPLAIVLLLRDGMQRVFSRWLLVVSTSLVFFAHGVEAWSHHPKFIDLLLGAAFRIDLPLREEHAKLILWHIGGLDILSAVLLLLRPGRPLLVWMGSWGLITACARIVVSGTYGVDEMLMRAPHFGVPFVLLVFSGGKNAPSSWSRDFANLYSWFATRLRPDGPARIGRGLP